MKKTRTETLAIDSIKFTALRTMWFQIIENLHKSITEKSGLECATRCSAYCCPKPKTPKNISKAVGHVAIMLPFEMEYILSKTGVSYTRLQHTRLELEPEIFIDIGFTTNSMPCPFLTTDEKCGIHEIRPLDCRSFPLIPVFSMEGTVNFRVDSECPSAVTFSSAYQTQFEKVWKELLPNLPMGYRTLYNQL